MTSKKEILLQIFVIFILPILVIYTGIVKGSDRIWVLGILISLLVIVLVRERWTKAMLGLTSHRMKQYIIPYAVFTLVAIVLVGMFGEKIGQEELTQWWVHHHFLYGFFIVSLFQEIGYRGYLMPALGKLLSNPLYVVLANALLFTFLHTIFPNPLIGLPLAFVGGLGFALMYMRYPSLVLIVISHSIINFFVVLYGFFLIPGVTY